MSEDFDPADCVGGLCPPHKMPAHLRRRFDHCVWSRAPGELWWRRLAYFAAADVARKLAEYEAAEPDAAFAARPNSEGPPEGDE